jgi:Pentapeptide repeats (8 copies)
LLREGIVEGLEKYYIKWPPQTPTCEIAPSAINIRNTTGEGMELDVGLGPGPYFIGHAVRLSDCEVRLHRTDVYHAVIQNVTFNNCRLVAKQKQKSLTWRNVVYDGCAFRGIYLFCEFGFRDAIDPSHPAGMRGCDFSQARLDSCVLGNADLSSLVLPQTPHLIFLEPGTYRDAINAIVPDQPLQNFLQMTSLRDEQCSAVAYSMEFLSKKPYPPEQVDLLLRRCRDLDFVRINF